MWSEMSLADLKLQDLFSRIQLECDVAEHERLLADSSSMSAD